MHERPTRSSVVDFATRFETGGATLKPLTITREVQSVLKYDSAVGWEWQGGGFERWQAFYFVWDKPTTIARRIACISGAFGHQPEVCFTRAGMQLRRVYGNRRYQANGVDLVFSIYEFVDRNVPIFVFASTWERNAPLASAAEMNIEMVNFSGVGVRGVLDRIKMRERGVTDEVRVFKLGVWGPRTIGEAEAAFQQQLNSLVRPAGENKK